MLCKNNTMKVTSVYVNPVADPQNAHVATASVTIDGVLAVHGVNIIKNSTTGEMFITFPYKKMANGKNAEIFNHPLNTETREYLTQMVVDAYERVLSNPDEQTITFDDEADFSLSQPKVTPCTWDGPVKAFASIVLDDGYLLNDMKIVRKMEAPTDSTDVGDYFVAMPRRKVGDGKVKTIYNPITKEFYAALRDQVMEEFKASILDEAA